LSQGAWRLPETSTPDLGSNTVISGHRYKYLPPNNLTFYLLDKLAAGDIINVVWKNKEYDYRVRESKIVPPTQISILDPTEEPILTLFTCDPIFSEKNRLVVTADLIQ
jgi:sortase A